MWEPGVWFCTHLVSFTNASSYQFPCLECPSSCFNHRIIEVNRQQGFLINSSSLQTKDFKGSGTCHPKDIKGCSYAFFFRLIWTSPRDGDQMSFQVLADCCCGVLLTSFLLSLSFCNSHLMDACGDFGAHSRKVVLFFTPYWTISAAFLYAEKQKWERELRTYTPICFLLYKIVTTYKVSKRQSLII